MNNSLRGLRHKQFFIFLLYLVLFEGEVGKGRGQMQGLER